LGLRLGPTEGREEKGRKEEGRGGNGAEGREREGNGMGNGNVEKSTFQFPFIYKHHAPLLVCLSFMLFCFCIDWYE